MENKNDTLKEKKSSVKNKTSSGSNNTNQKPAKNVPTQDPEIDQDNDLEIDNSEIEESGLEPSRIPEITPSNPGYGANPKKYTDNSNGNKSALSVDLSAVEENLELK